MNDRVVRHLLVYGADAVSILITVIALWRPVPRRSSWIWCAAALLGMVFIGQTIYILQTAEDWGIDFSFLWRGGALTLQGKDPYTVKGYLPPNEDLIAFPYPPFALPFCKLFALVPLATAKLIWISINVLICLSLGLLARRALIAQDGEQAPTLPSSVAALLTAPVILSLSTQFGMEAGQVVFLVTVALLGALTAQVRQPARPAMAAVCLGLASIKVHTMGPFLLLFLRRRDLRTWLFLCLIGVALLLAAGAPNDLPRKISAFLDVNAALREPGRPGDHSMLNQLTNSMIGFEHVFYRIGIVHRQTVTALALACILGLGGWLAYVINIKQTLPRGACCSLVSLYSMLFIYHRLYDLSILIIPLVYSASRLHTASRPARWCYAWVVTAVLLALNAPYGDFLQIQVLYPSSPILRILVLPSVTYLILSAMVALVAAASFEARHAAIHPALKQAEVGPRPTDVFVGQAG